MGRYLIYYPMFLQVEGLSSRLDQFIIAQNNAQKEQAQQEEMIFKGITQKAGTLSANLKSNQDAAEAYKKVSLSI